MSCAGDGAGCLVATPHAFFARVVAEDCGVALPAQGEYAIAQLFLPREMDEFHASKGIVEKCAPAACRCMHACRKRVSPCMAMRRALGARHAWIVPGSEATGLSLSPFTFRRTLLMIGPKEADAVHICRPRPLLVFGHSSSTC